MGISQNITNLFHGLDISRKFTLKIIVIRVLALFGNEVIGGLVRLPLPSPYLVVIGNGSELDNRQSSPMASDSW
jgi:hypothetical protein